MRGVSNQCKQKNFPASPTVQNTPSGWGTIPDSDTEGSPAEKNPGRRPSLARCPGAEEKERCRGRQHGAHSPARAPLPSRERATGGFEAVTLPRPLLPHFSPSSRTPALFTAHLQATLPQLPRNPPFPTKPFRPSPRRPSPVPPTPEGSGRGLCATSPAPPQLPASRDAGVLPYSGQKPLPTGTNLATESPASNRSQ